MTDETRLAIIEALAAQRRHSVSSPALSLSELAETVGVSDSMRFNYHLGKLCGPFVEKTDTGYKLSHAGHLIIAAALSTSVENPSESESTEEVLMDACPVCKTPVTGRRDDNIFPVLCENGHGFGEFLPPRLWVDRSIGDAAELATVRAVGGLREAKRGLCPKCSGKIEWQLVSETEAIDDSPYDTPVQTLGSCETCGLRFSGFSTGFVFFEPVIITRLLQAGIDVWSDPVQWLVRGEGGAVESYDMSTETVTARFEHPEFSLTATADSQLELRGFSFEAATTETQQQ